MRFPELYSSIMMAASARGGVAISDIMVERYILRNNSCSPTVITIMIHVLAGLTRAKAYWLISYLKTLLLKEGIVRTKSNTP